MKAELEPAAPRFFNYLSISTCPGGPSLLTACPINMSECVRLTQALIRGLRLLLSRCSPLPHFLNVECL